MRISRYLASWGLGGLLFLSVAISAALPQSKTKKEDRPKARPELESRSPEQPQQRDKKGFTIGVNVDMVLLHAAVYDKAGKFVAGLKKENFKLFEDGVAQTVTTFSQEDVPVSLGILIDVSGSMRNKIELVTRSALAFIKASNPEDQVFLVGFNDQVDLLEDYTSDIDTISDALDNILVTGGTALYDAIYLGVQKAQKGVKPKKAIIVITDGEDRDSYYKLDELLAKVQESDVAVYCVGFLNAAPDKGLFGRFSKTAPQKAQEALAKISEETGGKAFFPQKTSEMSPIVAEIAHELRNQYSIGFLSTNTAKDGSWRRLKLSLDSNPQQHHVRVRTGYFAPKLP
jgi:Ca-activated chloride channel family protein